MEAKIKTPKIPRGWEGGGGLQGHAIPFMGF